MVESNVVALTSSRERPASTASGYAMLIILLLAIALQIYGIVQLANDNASLLSVATVIVAPVVILFVACGFYMLQPNQAAAGLPVDRRPRRQTSEVPSAPATPRNAMAPGYPKRKNAGAMRIERPGAWIE